MTEKESTIRTLLHPTLRKFIDWHNEKTWNKYAPSLGSLATLPHYKYILLGICNRKTVRQLALELSKTYFSTRNVNFRKDSPYKDTAFNIRPQTVSKFVEQLKIGLHLPISKLLTYDELDELGFIVVPLSFKYTYKGTGNKTKKLHTGEDYEALKRERDALKIQADSLKIKVNSLEEQNEVEQMEQEERAFRDHERREALADAEDNEEVES